MNSEPSVIEIGLRRQYGNALILNVKAQLFATRSIGNAVAKTFDDLAATMNESGRGCLARLHALDIDLGDEIVAMQLSASAFFPSEDLREMLVESRGDIDRILAQLEGDERRAGADPVTAALYRSIRERYLHVRESLAQRLRLAAL